ncbi:MAG: hypothetical protein HQ483_09100 [Rhodospirillales bacterium]|nr:hypothetical protein [Rhodospirillales bacterium]
MGGSDRDGTDPASVTVRASKIALQVEREQRLARALRDNLGRRKGQIRARSAAGSGPAPGETDGGGGDGDSADSADPADPTDPTDPGETGKTDKTGG